MPSEIVTVAGQPYRLATWPRRITARVIDVVIAVFTCGLPGEAIGRYLYPFGIVYLVLGSAILRGQTAGKVLMGIGVIDATHGRRCTFGQELVRSRYIFYYNPIFLALSAFDAARGCFEKPETYVVRTAQFTPEEREMMREKPARLDLTGMRASIQKMREEEDGSNKRA
ncbi:MAG: RDD family protein [Chthoniobacter sp.]|nr:RDD family protein [Chthoniobacter sp.]